jgi:hypothetical protein
MGVFSPVGAAEAGMGSFYLFKLSDFRLGNIQNETLLNPEWT